MKKENIYKFLYAAGIMLIIGFCVRLAGDYVKYDVSNSAPFYVFVIVRAAEFILPAVPAFVAARLLKKKFS